MAWRVALSVLSSAAALLRIDAAVVRINAHARDRRRSAVSRSRRHCGRRWRLAWAVYKCLAERGFGRCSGIFGTFRLVPALLTDLWVHGPHQTQKPLAPFVVQLFGRWAHRSSAGQGSVAW